MRIYISKKDIEEAKNCMPNADYCKVCPIANALYRKFGKRYTVGSNWVCYRNKKVWSHSFGSSKFVRDFDCTGNAKPKHIILKEV